MEKGEAIALIDQMLEELDVEDVLQTYWFLKETFES